MLNDAIEGGSPPEATAALDGRVAAVGTAASVTALFSAAACCVLPLALAAMGVGAGGLAAFVPFHWPLTIAASLAIAAGWFLYFRRKRACATDESCAVAPAARATLVMLIVASVIIAISAIWSYIEAPLMKLAGGAA